MVCVLGFKTKNEGRNGCLNLVRTTCGRARSRRRRSVAKELRAAASSVIKIALNGACRFELDSLDDQFIGVVHWGGAFVPEGQITVDFDAQVRVCGLRFTTIFFLGLWMAFIIETRGSMLKIVFSLVALACALRIYAMFAMREFPISTLIGIIVEIACWALFLGIVIFCVALRARVQKDTETA